MHQLPDVILNVWPVIWLNDFLRYAVAASMLTLILRVSGKWSQRRKTQTQTATSTDVRRELLYSVSTVTIFSLVGLVLYLGCHGGVFQLYLEPASVQTVIGEFVAIVLLHDAYFYWLHRAMHHRWLFRRFHRLHHLTPWAAYAFAPAEAVLGREIFTGFQQVQNGSAHGHIYNPEDGRTYRAAITLVGGEALEVKGCWGPFCRSQQRRRLDSMPCEQSPL